MTMRAAELTALRAAAARRGAAGHRAPSPRIASHAERVAHDGWNDEVPTPAVELILELDGQWDVDLGGSASRHRAFIAGPYAGRVRTRARGAVRLIQLSLDPLTAGTLLGLPAGALTGQIAALEAVLGDRAARDVLTMLDEAWRGPNPGAAAERAAGTWLAANQHRGSPGASKPPADVQLAVALFDDARGSVTVDEVAALVGCSRRHLTRRFTAWTGLTPSDYRRLRRLACADELLRAAPETPLADVAAGSGYFDQAHLSRDVRGLAGTTPARLAERYAGGRPGPSAATD